VPFFSVPSVTIVSERRQQRSILPASPHIWFGVGDTRWERQHRPVFRTFETARFTSIGILSIMRGGDVSTDLNQENQLAA
jgi:hypothetical protein